MINRDVPLQFSLAAAKIDVAALRNSKRWLKANIKGTDRIFQIIEEWIDSSFTS